MRNRRINKDGGGTFAAFFCACNALFWIAAGGYLISLLITGGNHVQ